MKNYVDKDKLQEFATKLHNKQKTIFAPIEAIGSPLTAATVADMTDETKVYVYTGSETGYTAGNWYYYDGSEWTSGGVYNSAAVDTDVTLSVSGKAADAKAVGNALANVEIEVDATLTQAGMAADAKAAGDAIGKIEGALSTFTGNAQISITTPGYYNLRDTPLTLIAQSNNSFKCTYIECNAGDTFTISGSTGGAAARLYAFADANKNILANSGVGYTANNEIIVAPENTKYLAVNSYLDTGILYNGKPLVQTVVENTNDISELQNEKIPAIKRNLVYEAQKNYLDGSKIEDGYITANGTIHSHAYRGYSDYIPVKQGDIIRSYYRESQNTLKLVHSGFASMLNVAAYNDKKQVIEAAGTNNGTFEYTVPANVFFVRVSFTKSYFIDGLGMITINHIPTEYASFGDFYSALPDFLKTSFNEKTAQPVISKGFKTLTGALNDTDILSIGRTNVKKNQRYSFSGKITLFDTLIIGNNKDGNNGSWLVITNTNANIVTKSGGVIETSAHTHGLTISDFIFVEIVSEKDSEKCKVFIQTLSGNYEIDNETWYGYGDGNYFAESDGSTLTDCIFTFASADFRKNIWIFGDSYLSYTNSARWPYYAKDNGWIDNILLAGYPGEAPREAWAAFYNAVINYGRPYYAVWAQGMNGGGDTGDTINTDYSTYTNNFLDLCKVFNIVPILATIPTVPNINHEARNNWIRNSGYRYIDFAEAVGAQSDGTWYTGLLSEDDVHPTTLGAKALFMRAIQDCPEITFDR